MKKTASFRSWSGNQQDVARVLGLSDRRVRELVKTGVLPGPQAGLYDLTSVVPAYIDFLRRDTGGLKAERTRCAKLKADLLSLDLQQREGEVLPVAEIRDQWARVATTIRSRFLGLATKMAPRLVGQPVGHIHNQLRRETREILTELSRMDAATRPRR